MNFINVWNSIVSNEGASYNLSTGEMNPTTGYMVALKGCERIYTAPENLNQFQDVVQNYLSGDLLNIVLSNKDLYLGFWLHEGKLYIDLSENIQNKISALKMGMERGQITIYNCENTGSIFLHGDHPLYPIDKDILTDKKY